MDQTEPTGASQERAPLPPLPDPDSVDVFTITDKQRQAALDHLDGQFSLGNLDIADLERRKSAVTEATNVAELLAATAPAAAAWTASAAPPVRKTNSLALTVMVVVGVLLVVTVVSRLA